MLVVAQTNSEFELLVVDSRATWNGERMQDRKELLLLTAVESG